MLSDRRLRTRAPVAPAVDSLIGPIADIGRSRCALHDAESALAANMPSYMRSRNAIHVNDVVSIGSDV